MNDSRYGERVDDATVRFVRTLPGPIERVWEYIVDGDKRSRWLCAGDYPERPGAPIEMRFHNERLSGPDDITPPESHAKYAGEMLFSGRVVACEPPRLIAHTWEFDGDETEVRYELESVGDEVRLTLTHTRLGSDDEVLSVSGGWHTHLGILAAVLADESPPPFWKTHSRLEQEYREQFGI